MDANILKQIMCKHWASKGYAVHSEISVNKMGSLRADVLAVSMKNEIIIVETKSSPSDFKSDKKWWQYKTYCHKIYFCMSLLTYNKVKHLIPKNVGVFVVDKTFAYKLVGRSSKSAMNTHVVLDVITRMMFRGSSVQRYKLKSKTSGAKLVARTAVEALYTRKVLPDSIQATRIVMKAIDQLV